MNQLQTVIIRTMHSFQNESTQMYWPKPVCPDSFAELLLVAVSNFLSGEDVLTFPNEADNMYSGESRLSDAGGSQKTFFFGPSGLTLV